MQNGNDPLVFSQTKYLVSLPEDIPPGSNINNPQGRRPRNSQLSFSIDSVHSEEMLELDRERQQHPGGQAPSHRHLPPPPHSALHLLLLRGSRQQALQHRPEQRLDRESGVISPRLKVEASYLLTVVVEDKKNNLSVGRPIYLTV